MKKILIILIIILMIGCAQKEPIKEVVKMGGLKLTSPAFKDKGKIPAKYTCQGEDINPPLVIDGIPEGTKSLVLIVDDPDAPVGVWDHWIVWNIDPKTTKIEENSIPEGASQGLNDFKVHEYKGPCPPSGTHRYLFKLFALDTTLNMHSDSIKQDIENAMNGQVLAQTELVGLYKKS